MHFYLEPSLALSYSYIFENLVIAQSTVPSNLNLPHRKFPNIIASWLLFSIIFIFLSYIDGNVHEKN